MSVVQLIPLPDGPYQVAGAFELVTHDGQAIAAAEPTIYLCRCGHSASKPFCDGSHARIGWKDDE